MFPISQHVQFDIIWGTLLHLRGQLWLGLPLRVNELDQRLGLPEGEEPGYVGGGQLHHPRVGVHDVHGARF